MSRMGVARSALMVGLVTLFWLRAASGQADDRDESLVRDGVRLRREGKDQAALAVFRAAWRVKPTPRALAQIGLAELALGDWVAADHDIESALESKADPWIAKNFKSLSESLDAVQGHLGRLQVLGSPVGAIVRLDGRKAGSLPMPEPASVPTGEVAISVSAPSYISIIRRVTIPSPGLVVRETINLQRADPATDVAVTSPRLEPGPLPAAGEPLTAFRPPPPRTISAAESARQSEEPATARTMSDVEPVPAEGQESVWPWQKTSAVVAGGMGVLFLGGGIGAQLLSDSRNRDFNQVTDAPNATGLCNRKLDHSGGGPCSELLDDGNRFHTAAVIGFAGAGAALASSVLFYFMIPSRPDEAHLTALAFCQVPGERSTLCALSVRF